MFSRKADVEQLYKTLLNLSLVVAGLAQRLDDIETELDGSLAELEERFARPKDSSDENSAALQRSVNEMMSLQKRTYAAVDGVRIDLSDFKEMQATHTYKLDLMREKIEYNTTKIPDSFDTRFRALENEIRDFRIAFQGQYPRMIEGEKSEGEIIE